jgi:hypothetical protein
VARARISTQKHGSQIYLPKPFETAKLVTAVSRGDTLGAAENYERYLKLDPKDAASAQIRSQLRALRSNEKTPKRRP